jgi:hypothetical protein
MCMAHRHQCPSQIFSIYIVGGWTPVFSTHHLPTTLRSLTFADAQMSAAHVFFRGPDVRKCLSLQICRPAFSFARQLPASLTHLRLTCDGYDLVDGLHILRECPNLEVLDVDVTGPPLFWRDNEDPLVIWRDNEDRLVHVANAFASLSLKRLGLHASSGCSTLYIPRARPDFADMHLSFFIGATTHYPHSLEGQMDQESRCNVTKLALYVEDLPWCPSLLGFSALKELVIGDTWWELDDGTSMPFSMMGLQVVAGTLRHLTLSSSQRETCVELPQGLRLRSFVCVCSGSLLLHCDANALARGLGDVLLGYATLDGTGAALVEELGPRLMAVQLEVLGFTKRRLQSLMFTRADLVGQWWHGVFHPSKQQVFRGCWCCRVRLWVQGCLCPAHITFLRYGIVSAQDDRDVLIGEWEELFDKPHEVVLPAWHTIKSKIY